MTENKDDNSLPTKFTRISNPSDRETLTKKTPILPAPIQLDLFRIEKQVTFEGVDMGVLENGIPFLSESGLAKMCGVHRSVINELSTDWIYDRNKPRAKK